MGGQRTNDHVGLQRFRGLLSLAHSFLGISNIDTLPLASLTELTLPYGTLFTNGFY